MIVRGDVKLFDFGLATVMPIFGDPYENIFDMSGAGKWNVSCHISLLVDTKYE